MRIFSSLLSFLCVIIIGIPNKILASGAYDKGTATGKGNWEINLTINPFNLIYYGQNYGILSYGLSDKLDIVSYYAEHKTGLKSIYFGSLYQFVDKPYIDLASAIGIRKVFDESNSYHLFAPQLLYNIKLAKKNTIGGSIVNVIDLDKKLNNKGVAIDLTFYKHLPFMEKISPKIIDVYFGFGIFKNTSMNLYHDKVHLQYSLDIKFN